MKNREYWLDYLRAFACVLVTIGHLLMSFQSSQIIHNNLIVTSFISLIYCFHVYIFFFCSGYLFQARFNPANQATKIGIYKIEKCVNFFILYVFFSGVTYVFKLLFSSVVNTSVNQSFLYVLSKEPINQMWYLYAISAIFLFAYFIRTYKSAYIILGIALVMKIIECIPNVNFAIPLPINYLFEDYIWFVMGQLFAYTQIKLDYKASIIWAVLFFAIFSLRTLFKLEYNIIDEILTLLGILASVGIIYNLTKNKTAITGVWKYLSDYMLQIYLLHTMCAAGIRAILFRLDVSTLLPHLILGILFSFVLPIICAMVAERIKILNIFFFPTKTIKQLLCKDRSI